MIHKRGRPPKPPLPPKQVKNFEINVRVTVDQLLILRKAANKQRMTLSAYLLSGHFGPQHKYWRPAR